MADSILTPGYEEVEQTPIEKDSEQYLQIDNYLSEYENDEQKSVVRENLKVYPKESVYTKTETDSKISEKIRGVLQDHLDTDDPHNILPQVDQKIADMVKTDGSTPFTLPQKGVDPQSDNDLATKKYIDQLLKDHLGTDDPHQILPIIQGLLLKYALNSDVYKKSETYTKQETENLQKQYVKRDGSTPFTKAQIGADPTIDSHLATKRYIDKILYEHEVDVDPHGFISTLNNKLEAYIKKADVYDKNSTYSRKQIDSIINKATQTAVENKVQDFVDQTNDKYNQILQQGYVKSDGSIPFIKPQSSVDATEDQHLVTLRQLNLIRDFLQSNINNVRPIWLTSGPVESEVGKVEEGTEFPEIVTLQEIMDAIFYGKSVSIEVPDYTTITETCSILLCIHGSLSLIESAEVYQGDELIHTFTKQDFENGCMTVNSNPILEDTQFTFRVTYSNGAIHEDVDTTKVAMPVFVGLLPKWKFANTITMEYLKELEAQDTEGTQNRFLTYGSDVTSISFKYVFTDSELRHPFVVIPENYPDLNKVVTDSQRFGIEAFDVIDMIPLHIEGVAEDTIYKIYVYKQALSSLNQEVTFNFS